jgi:hypothetical protein
MQDYDAAQYDPPAPVVSVTLRSQTVAADESTCVLLLDTGADITLLPRRAVEGLRETPIVESSYKLVSFDGTQSSAAVATLDLIFLNRRFRGKFAIINDDRGILGRDVVNHLVLILDGPGKNWREA